MGTNRKAAIMGTRRQATREKFAEKERIRGMIARFKDSHPRLHDFLQSMKIDTIKELGFDQLFRDRKGVFRNENDPAYKSDLDNLASIFYRFYDEKRIKIFYILIPELKITYDNLTSHQGEYRILLKDLSSGIYKDKDYPDLVRWAVRNALAKQTVKAVAKGNDEIVSGLLRPEERYGEHNLFRYEFKKFLNRIMGSPDTKDLVTYNAMIGLADLFLKSKSELNMLIRGAASGIPLTVEECIQFRNKTDNILNVNPDLDRLLSKMHPNFQKVISNREYENISNVSLELLLSAADADEAKARLHGYEPIAAKLKEATIDVSKQPAATIMRELLSKVPTPANPDDVMDHVARIKGPAATVVKTAVLASLACQDLTAALDDIEKLRFPNSEPVTKAPTPAETKAINEAEEKCVAVLKVLLDHILKTDPLINREILRERVIASLIRMETLLGNVSKASLANSGDAGLNKARVANLSNQIDLVVTLLETAAEHKLFAEHTEHKGMGMFARKKSTDDQGPSPRQRLLNEVKELKEEKNDLIEAAKEVGVERKQDERRGRPF